MSMIYDLRSFLTTLEQHGQLVHIKKPVSIIHEVADIGATCERTGGPAPLFESLVLVGQADSLPVAPTAGSPVGQADSLPTPQPTSDQHDGHAIGQADS